MSEDPKWMSDPSVSHIAKEKLEFLKDLSFQGQNKSQKEMMLYVMGAMKKAKAKNIQFAPQELQAMIAAIQKHSSPEELAKMEEILKKAPHP